MTREEFHNKLKEIGVESVEIISEDLDACGSGCCSSPSEVIFNMSGGYHFRFRECELE